MRPELPAGRFDLILADPPWKFVTWGKKQTKGAVVHYKLMTLDDIKALPIASIAADDCVLVLWATQAQLHHALEVVSAWGFTFKTAGAWGKRTNTNRAWQFGTGYWLRSTAEFYLLATRGKPKSIVRNVRNLIVAPVARHSEKPVEMYHSLERMFPKARKLELFARQRRTGWEAWGQELSGGQRKAKRGFF